jgi:hypothetical protein
MFPFNDKFISLRNEIAEDDTQLWENFKGEYNNFFGNYNPWNFTFISNDTIEFRSDIWNNGESSILTKCPISYIQASNEY